MYNPVSIFIIFFRLGCTSFGGPVAHLGYFRDEFIVRRQWMTESAMASLIALCQFVPGPTSSQVGAAIGFQRGGYVGATMAWLGFTLPSALLMLFAAMFFTGQVAPDTVPWLHGLKLVAVAVVAHALWGMQKTLCPTMATRMIALLSAALLLFFSSALAHVVVILIGAGVGCVLFKPKTAAAIPPETALPGSARRTATLLLVVFGTLLFSLPLLTQHHAALNLFDSLFRAGALVFGGGHVVLPLLSAELVETQQIDTTLFISGYALAQAVPGPLFTFATFLGAAVMPQHPIIAGALATVVIFLPGMLLLFGLLPFWQTLSRWPRVQAGLVGVNATVVGLLLSTLVSPIATSAITSWYEVLIACIGFIALTVLNVRPLIVIALMTASYAGIATFLY
ncbi:chromate efflux transporter [Alteromonas oceanisediminis]|uniref:chromate efflux transporter n=1 Tax=Alteromonas oceanisediminis TaxID=2836180 RepID=UPI001BDB545B|nr:chromate efflux transporter [Alteromonas oceanisediminis]MBT0585131.1 chromate efflux transporter [Alteromonas oceanisediminis]